MRRIGFIIYPGIQVMALAVVTVFELANALGEPVYDVRFVSESGGAVRTSIGMRIETDPFADPKSFDSLIIGGGVVIEPSPPGLVAYLRSAAGASRRLASICTGAFALAEAGVLDGRRATTHWFHARALQAAYPKIKVDEDRIFTVDGALWTSAGMTAGIDLALAMVEQDLGAAVARSVAKKLVVYHRRAGGQSQFSALLDLEPKSDRIQGALVYAKKNLASPLSVEQLAEAARLSPRQFSRVFRAETGQSPAQAVETLRVESAKLMMEEGRHSMEMVARETGFADSARMRRAFLRAFGHPPQAIRRTLRAAADAIPMPA